MKCCGFMSTEMAYQSSRSKDLRNELNLSDLGKDLQFSWFQALGPFLSAPCHNSIEFAAGNAPNGRMCTGKSFDSPDVQILI